MFPESEFVKHRNRVGRQNLLRSSARKKRQQDGDQTADDMRVAVTEIAQHRLPCAAAGKFALELADVCQHAPAKSLVPVLQPAW